MYRVTRELAGLTGEERVYDLYCGAGSISLFVARHCKEVIGAEIVPEAVEDAVRVRSRAAHARSERTVKKLGAKIVI